MADVNRQWLLATRPVGMIGESNFEYRETAIPSPGEGEVLVRNLYLSFDPAQRGWTLDRPSYIPPVQIGEPMRGGAVGQVVESNHSDFEVGSFVQGTFGWQDYAVASPTGPMPMTAVPAGVPLTLPLGVLGITGLTAYFGLLDLGQPKKGETVVVSGAAGATGSIAGQIAKRKGCRVIGIAGGPEKCAWLTEKAGFDAAVDYKSENLQKRLRELCPGGIDIFFDNVGGETLETVIGLIAQNARIVMCGGISGYNEKEPPPGPRNLMNLIIMRGRMQGFIVLDYVDRFADGVKELAGWVSRGEILYLEDIQEGFENIPKTLQRLYLGQNFGKQILKLADPPIDTASS